MVSFIVLEQFEDLRKDIKEGNERIKTDVEKVSSDIKCCIIVAESLKEGIKDLKDGVKGVEDITMGIKESVKEGVRCRREGEEDLKVIKEVVKEGLKEAMNEMKNTEKAEMKESDTRISMGNIEIDDFSNPRVPALGELYLVVYIFALNMEFSQ